MSLRSTKLNNPIKQLPPGNDMPFSSFLQDNYPVDPSPERIVSIDVQDKILVRSPYNKEFVRSARRLGGRWDGRRWVFHLNEEERVRALCMEIYGDDGRSIDTVSVRVRLTERDNVRCGPIKCGTRIIAAASGKRSGVRLGDDVVVEKGDFRSGGSWVNWETQVCGSATVVLHNFPRTMAIKLGLKIVKVKAVQATVGVPGRRKLGI